MTDALIGYTGFVGSNIVRPSDAAFNSKNIETIRGQSFDRVVCAGVTAVKWWANANATEDRARIERLIDDLDTIDASQFTLISTVDVYRDPKNVDETSAPAPVQAYGVNRLRLEQFVADRFPRHTIVRLPALVGRGLKKNAVFDLMHNNQLERIHPESSFQWYSLDTLSDDLIEAETFDMRVVNVVTEPVSMRDIRDRFFPGKEIGSAAQAAHYDVHTRYTDTGYILDRSEVMDALATFIEAVK